MNNNDKYHLNRLWLAGLMIVSWALCLGSVAFPYDHILGYHPLIMYVGYGLMLALSITSLLAVFLKKPLLADLSLLLSQLLYFGMFGILFVLRLLNGGYVQFFPLMMISLFVMAILALAGACFMLLGKKQLGYLFSIIAYSCFTMSVVLESYPVAYDLVSETYGYIKLVYAFTIIAAGILGIVHSAKLNNLSKKESHP